MNENQLSEEQLFNRLANRIVGYWYRFDEDEVLIFSLAEAPATLTDATIVTKGIRYPALYKLGFLPGWLAYLTISQWAYRQERIIEVMTKDKLVLKDNTSRLIIYERKTDQKFVEAVINSVPEEDEP